MIFKSKFSMAKKQAFTLIELLIVIAIIGILFIVLVSRVDFATNKSKASGVQADFRSFQVAFDTVAKENAGFATFGWDTGDINGNRIRDSYDKGDTNKNGKEDPGETFIGRKIYDETWTGIYTLTNPAKANDNSAIVALEEAINNNLDPKLHVTINNDLTINMANSAKDPWKNEYHGYYITNATVDKMDRGAIIIYSNGANGVWGSAHDIANGVVTVSVPGNNVYGQDDYSLVVTYTYTNGYGEVQTLTTGFVQNQGNIPVGGNNASGGTSGGSGTQTPSDSIDYEKASGMYFLDLDNYRFVQTEGATCDGTVIDGKVYPFSSNEVPEQYNITTSYNSAMAYYNGKLSDVDMIYGDFAAVEVVDENVYWCLGTYFPKYNAVIVGSRTLLGSLADMVDGYMMRTGGCEHGDVYSKLQITLFDDSLSLSETQIRPEGCVGMGATLSIALEKQNSVSVYDVNDFSEYYLFTSTETVLGGLSETGFVFDMEVYDLKFYMTNGVIDVKFYYEDIGKTRDDFFHPILAEFGDENSQLIIDMFNNNEYFSVSLVTGGYDVLIDGLHLILGWNGAQLNFPWHYALQGVGLIPADFVDASELVSVQQTREFENHNALFVNSSNVQFVLSDDLSHSTISEMSINGIRFVGQRTAYNTYKMPEDVAFRFANSVNTVKFILNDGTVVRGEFSFYLEDRVLNNHAVFVDTNVEFTLKAFSTDIGNVDSVIINDMPLDSWLYSFAVQNEGRVDFKIDPSVVYSLVNNETHAIQILLNDGSCIDIDFSLDLFECPNNVEHGYYEPGLYSSTGQLIVDWDTLVAYGLNLAADVEINSITSVPNVQVYSVLKNFVADGSHVILSIGNISRIGDYAFYGIGTKGAFLGSSMQLLVSGSFGDIVIDQLIIPSSISEFGKSCFEEAMINTVLFNGTASDWASIQLDKYWNKQWSSDNIIHAIDSDIEVEAYVPVGPSDPTNYLAPGLYAMDGTLVLTWNQLVSAPYNFNISATYTSSNYLTSTTSLHYILTHNNFGVDLSEGFILSVGENVSTIGKYALYIMDNANNASYTGPTLRTLIINNKSTKFDGYALGKTIWVETFMYKGTSAEWDSLITKTNYWYGSSTTTKFTVYCTDGEAQKNGCVTGDTLILMADGSYKRIDELTYDDMVMVWNFETGTYDIAPISIIFYHGDQEWEVVNLEFTDGTILKIINSHGLFSVEDNKYVYLDVNNVDQYFGKSFVKYDNGNYITVKLASYTVTTEYTGSYCLQTVGANNYIAAGMFSLTKPDIEGIYDYFELGSDMKYDAAKMQADIEKYGLFTYEDYIATGITYEQYVAFNGAYMKILIGRGIITWQDVLDTINNYIL